ASRSRRCGRTGPRSRHWNCDRGACHGECMLRAPSTPSTHRPAGQATTPHPRLPVRPWGTLPDNAAHNSPVVLEVPTTVAVLMDLLTIREDHASYGNAVKLIQDAADGAVARLEPHVPVTRLQ